MKNDPVNPKHYHGDLVKRIIEYFDLCFDLGTAEKYLLRAGNKVSPEETKIEAELRDLKKAIWYINRKIEKLEGKPHIGDLQ